MWARKLFWLIVFHERHAFGEQSAFVSMFAADHTSDAIYVRPRVRLWRSSFATTVVAGGSPARLTAVLVVYSYIR